MRACEHARMREHGNTRNTRNTGYPTLPGSRPLAATLGNMGLFRPKPAPFWPKPASSLLPWFPVFPCIPGIPCIPCIPGIPIQPGNQIEFRVFPVFPVFPVFRVFQCIPVCSGKARRAVIRLNTALRALLYCVTLWTEQQAAPYWYSALRPHTNKETPKVHH